jgi:hypothetical protein
MSWSASMRIAASQAGCLILLILFFNNKVAIGEYWSTYTFMQLLNICLAQRHVDRLCVSHIPVINIYRFDIIIIHQTLVTLVASSLRAQM